MNCPKCAASLPEGSRFCQVCHTGIARVRLRFELLGLFTFEDRIVACKPDEVDELDGQEVEMENPEELPEGEN